MLIYRKIHSQSDYFSCCTLYISMRNSDNSTQRIAWFQWRIEDFVNADESLSLSIPSSPFPCYFVSFLPFPFSEVWDQPETPVVGGPGVLPPRDVTSTTWYKYKYCRFHFCDQVLSAQRGHDRLPQHLEGAWQAPSALRGGMRGSLSTERGHQRLLHHWEGGMRGSLWNTPLIDLMSYFTKYSKLTENT